MNTTGKTKNGTEGTPVPEVKEKNNYIRINRLLFYFMLSVFLVVLIAGLYFHNRQQQFGRQINTFINNQNALNNQFAGKQDLQKLETDFNATISELTREERHTNQDWAIAEAEYLLILALHRLTLEKDVNTALFAMQGAASRLQAIENPALFPVREQLGEDIDRLKSIQVVDTSAMAIFLADMINRVDQLPLKNLKDLQTAGRPPDMTEQDSQKEGEGVIRRLFAEIWHTFKSLLIVRHKNEISQALIPPGQEYFLYQNLRLELENARLSVLRRDTDNLETSIGIIIDWLEIYFDRNDSSVVNLVETMQQMQHQDLSPELPDINSSLESLRAFMRSRDN